MAPEVIRGEKYNKSCDVYSFGITLWEMLTRIQPYRGMLKEQVIVGVGNHKLRPLIEGSIQHQLLQELIERLLILYKYVE